MKSLSDFLGKFRKLVKNQSHPKREISQVVSEVAGVVLDEKLIDFNNKGEVVIKCPPALRSEIFLKKKAIIEALNSRSEIKVSNILF